MKLKSLLQEKKTAISDRWLKDTMATYASDTSSFLLREKDQFANPVGHVLRNGLPAIFDNLLQGMDADTICFHLNEIIKIRAIQDFSPSRAVSFVYLLKSAIRAELKEIVVNPLYSVELAEIDSEIDQIALFAFDIYSRCREQVYELRVNEIKRSVSGIMKRYDEDDAVKESFTQSPSNGASSQEDGR